MRRNLILASLMIVVAGAPGAAGMTLRQYELGWARYYARRDGVPMALVEAIIIVESGGNPYAMSTKGAEGVMQLMPRTASEYSIKNRFLIQENIRGGVGYLASLIRAFHGDLRLAVASYYAGTRMVERQKLACSSPAVYQYVSRVASVYRRLLANRR